MRIIGALLAILILCGAQTGYAEPRIGKTVGPARCAFQWDEPTTNTDGSRLQDLKEYRLYLSQTAPVQQETAAKIILAVRPDPQDGSTAETSCPHVALTHGQWYVIVTAVDVDGNESAPSNTLPFFYDARPPAPPQ